MSLMLTFFVLLVSFSQLQQEKIVKVLQSIQGAMGTQPDLLAPPPLTGAYPPDAAAIERLARRLQEKLQTSGMDKEVRLEYDGQGGLRISLPSGVLFDSGSAMLKSDPVTQRTLRDVADVLKGLPRAFFEVRGHTDNRPLAPYIGIS
jgi:Flagellar motor protein